MRNLLYTSNLIRYPNCYNFELYHYNVLDYA